MKNGNYPMKYDPILRFLGNRYENASLSHLALSTSSEESLKKWINSNFGFFIYEGGVGVGKTWTMVATAKYLFDKMKKRGVIYPSVFCYPEYQIYQNISDSWKRDDRSEEDEKRKICEIKILLIDDLGSSTAHDWQKNLMFEIVNYRYNSGLKTFFTTNLSPDELTRKFHPRLVDRLGSNENIWIENYEESKRGSPR